MRRPLSLLAAVVLTAPLAAALSPTAAAAPAAPAPPAAQHAAVPDQLLVAYVRGSSAADRDRARGRVGAARVERVVPERADRLEVELVRLPAGSDRSRAQRELESEAAVAYAEPNYVLTRQVVPTDPRFADGSLWGLYSATSTPANAFGSGAASAWSDGSVGSRSVYVGVIDEGIQFDHPDLSGQVWVNPHDTANGRDDDGNGYVDDLRGWDFANDDNTIYDGGTRGSLDDHGTHVSGTIGAKADGQGVVGVDHQVTLISGKFLGRRGGTLSDAVQAVDYMTDLKVRHGLDIVATNNSWGGGGYSQSLLDAITRGAKQQILFVAAAGNSGSDNDSSPSYPSNYDTTAGAGYDAVIAVAAIDKTGALASFSQYGATTVDLGAPGVGILSTTAYNKLESYNGTSMATPHVTGAAALYRSVHTSASALQVRQAVLGSTAPTPSLQGKTVTGGRLDMSGF